MKKDTLLGVYKVKVDLIKKLTLSIDHLFKETEIELSIVPRLED